MKNAVWLIALIPSLVFAQTGNRCPNILIVFDVSGSMSTPVPPDNTASRYQVGTTAVNYVLDNNSQNFRYGLELFGLEDTSSACLVSTCYYPQSGCDSVLCSYTSNSDIKAVLAANDATGSTPTAQAITDALSRADMQDSTRRRFIVLITDGDPNCSSGDAVTDTTSAITTAFNQGIKTYVLGFNGGTPANLNAMAQAGGTARNTSCSSTNPCYYNASTPTDIQNALAAIIGAVGGELGGGSCDDTCYGGGCPSGQICKNAQCQANPCASVTCGAGTYCMEGQCVAPCKPACQNDQYCDNGVCKPDPNCGTQNCTVRNQTCVNGACVEDYCSGVSYDLNGACAALGDLCVKNSCQDFGVSGGTGGGSGAGADGGSHSDGGSGNNTTNAGSGCCSGAPGAVSLFGLALALSLLGARRRVR